MTTLTTTGVTYPDGRTRTTAQPFRYRDKAIFGYGNSSGSTSITNLVSNTGNVSNDVTGVGTVRLRLAAATYGGDKAIFGFGDNNSSSAIYSMTNLVSNIGVVGADVTGVGSTKTELAAAGYGGDKAIFGYGYGPSGSSTNQSTTNLVSNIGVISSDVTGVGSSRRDLAAACYGVDKAIFGYGFGAGTSPFVNSMTNLVSNTGVVSTDVTGVGTVRMQLAAAGYGGDKAIFGYGENLSVYFSMTNLVSNIGVVGADVTGVGTIRGRLAAAGIGGDKAIFAYGVGTNVLNISNLVSNTGVVATDSTGVGTARYDLAASGYGS